MKSKLQKGAVLRAKCPGSSLFFTSVFNACGIARMFQYTARDIDNPLVVSVDNRMDVLDLCADFPENAYHLTSTCWPGPMNLILKGNGKTSELLSAGSSYLMFTMPASKEFRNIIAQAQTPLALCECDDDSDYCPPDIETITIDQDVTGDFSVVSFADEQKPVLVREGSIPTAAIKEIVGPLLPLSTEPKEYWSALASENPLATPFFIADKGTLFIDKSGESANIGVITFGSAGQLIADTLSVKTLSDSEDICEAAVNFFSTIREMDKKGFNSIIMETLPEKDLGRQINARLRTMGMDIANFAFLMNENN